LAYHSKSLDLNILLLENQLEIEKKEIYST